MTALEDRNHFVDRLPNSWLRLMRLGFKERWDGRGVTDALDRRSREGTDVLVLVASQQPENVIQTPRRLEVEHSEDGPEADIG